MNIYFAGSIRGGRNDTDLYAEIVALLRHHGEVLTEHVADKSLSSYGQTYMTDQEIYDKDVGMIDESDVLIAEITQPSIGVGYEIGYAESVHKNIICLYRPSDDKSASAMVAGNPSVKIIEYDTVEELQEVFEKELRQFYE